MILFKPFRDLKVRGKLNVMTGIAVMGIVLVAWGAGFFYNAEKALSLIINVDRVHNMVFYNGVHHAQSFIQSGNEGSYHKALEAFEKANLNSLLIARIDSVMEANNPGQLRQLLLVAFPESLNNDKGNARSLGRQLKLFVSLGFKPMLESQKVSYQSYLIGKELCEILKEYRQSPSDELIQKFDAKLQKMSVVFSNFSSIVNRVIDLTDRLFAIALALLVGLTALFTALLSFLVSRSLTKPIRVLVADMQKMSLGNIHSEVKQIGKDEIGELARNLNSIRLGLHEVVVHAQRIARRDFTSAITPRSSEDELSFALNKMANDLEEAKVRRERDQWINDGLIKMGEFIQGDLTVRQLSVRILEFFSDFSGIELGAVYAFDEEAGHLQLTGTLGLNADDIVEFIKPGQGIIGRVAVKHKIQVIENLQKYHRLNLASGDYLPSRIYLLPLVYNMKLRGVVELAAMKPLSELQLEFLKIASERAAIHMRTAISRYRLEELLNTSRKQSEKLQQQTIALQESLAENQQFRANLEKRIRENEEMRVSLEWEKSLLDTLLTNIPDSIYFKDLKSRFIKTSRSMAAKFGCSDELELVGRSDADFFPKELARQKFDVEQSIISTGQPVIGLIELDKGADGKPVYLSTTKMPFKNKKGETIGTFGISRDITAIKQLEMEIQRRNVELQEQKEKLKLAYEELQAQQEELRVANEELALQTKSLSENEKALQVQQEELRVANEELEQRAHELEVQKSEIVAKNEQLLKTQNDLQMKAIQLETNSRYKSEFLANMSHELRTPLNSMLILSKLVSSNKTGNLTAEQVKSIRIIHKSGSDLLQLINEILDLSKIEAGKMSLEYSTFSTSGFIDEVLQGFQPVAKEKGLMFEVTVEPGFPATLNSDRNRLMQIARNLLSNAFKFTAKGSVKVYLSRHQRSGVGLASNITANEVFSLSVTDTGVGIPKSKKEAIFEAFQQADGTISRKYGGTGLGLSISKELTRMLGGEITVESEEGTGSVFTLWLPLPVESEPARPDTASQTDEVGASQGKGAPDSAELPLFVADDRDKLPDGQAILIVHSEQTEARKLVQQCRSRGFIAIAVASIADAVAAAGTVGPRAIILSSALNNHDDINLLKGHPAFGDIPVHFVNRIEDDSLAHLEGLKTPRSDDFDLIAGKTDGTITAHYRNILIVEDDPTMREAIQELFKNREIYLDEAKNGEQAFEKISQRKYDCIILDLGLPDFSGKELLKKLEKAGIPIPHVIVHTSRELTNAEHKELRKYAGSIVIKGLKSDERLMDEVSLFLHQLGAGTPRISPVQSVSGNSDLAFKGKRILIVDDDIRNIYALAQVLEEKGIEVLEAENGKDALERLKEHPDIDLILMDLMMPEMDGYEAMQIIRKTPEIKHIPIITITAKAMKDDYREAIAHGANDYISKPVDDSILFNLLKIWLSK